MNKVIGIFAHVDCGKTTFSEQLLYYTKAIRKLGRVDHKNTTLDNNTIEKERGITIFSGQANFKFGEDVYYLLDTPGHVDFAGEMERVINVIDYAIILINCKDGVQAHTRTVYRLLESKNKPIFFFINKIDLQEANIDYAINSIKDKLTQNIIDFNNKINVSNDLKNFSIEEQLAEDIAMYDDELLDKYLSDNYDENLFVIKLPMMIKQRKIIPYFSGSALNCIGIEQFLKSFHVLTYIKEDISKLDKFSGQVYQIRYDNNGERLTFLKVLSGELQVRDKVNFKLRNSNEISCEKVNQIRIYNGNKFENVQSVKTGQICAVTGFNDVYSGDKIGNKLGHSNFQIKPVMMSKVIYNGSKSMNDIYNYFKILNEEEPLLNISWKRELDELRIYVMGIIQLQVLQEIVKDRFNIDIQFGECEIVYKETILNTVIGYGHFEPLRHYAEVHVELSPLERGKGIIIENECPNDLLNTNFQNLICTHIAEKNHKGILTGSDITDIKIKVIAGKSHIKHTEGGDFREATYRAIRQGLEKANNVLLEPYYNFILEIPEECIGRAISDIQKMSGKFDTPRNLNNSEIRITGKCPVSEMMNYNKEVIIYTKGKGSLQLLFSGYEICHNEQEIIEKINYNKERDMENTSTSIFCAKGAGYPVKWYDVEKYIHIKS